jgi:outer membrane lipoprotein-sorting protein
MNSKRLRLLLLILLTAFPLTLAHAQEVRSGEDVLRAMHDRYAKSWYETLTFTQKSTTYNPDGTTKVETWYEALALPGKLRIDIGPPSDGNGFLMVDGTLTIVAGGKESGTRPRMNMLLVLGFDVYRQAPEDTIKITKAEGYDLTKFHEETWEGQPVYVVGAENGDLASKQFWVDKNRLLFVRLFEPTRADPSKFQNVRFDDYRQLAGGWVAARVEVYVDDKKVFSEEYSDMQNNAKLDAATFDPKQYSSTHWEKP